MGGGCVYKEGNQKKEEKMGKVSEKCFLCHCNSSNQCNHQSLFSSINSRNVCCQLSWCCWSFSLSLSLNTSLNWWLTKAFQSDFLFFLSVSCFTLISLCNGMEWWKGEYFQTAQERHVTCVKEHVRICRARTWEFLRFLLTLWFLPSSLMTTNRDVKLSQEEQGDLEGNYRVDFNEINNGMPLFDCLSSGYLSMLKWQDKGLVDSLTVLWSHIRKC